MCKKYEFVARNSKSNVRSATKTVLDIRISTTTKMTKNIQPGAFWTSSLKKNTFLLYYLEW